MNKKAETLEPFIASLDDVIAAAVDADLVETAALLRIARLDLLMRLNGIDPNELEVLSYALQRSVFENDKGPPERPRRTPRRRRRSAN